MAKRISEVKKSFSKEEAPTASTTEISSITEKMLWAFEQDKRTRAVTVLPMNGKKIIIHGKQEAELFCSFLLSHFQ